MENAIGKNLGRCLRSRGITESGFAMQLGVDEDKVKQWLDGTQEPTPGETAMMAQVLGVSLEELLHDDGQGGTQADNFGEQGAEATETDQKTGQKSRRASYKWDREYKYREVLHDTVWAKIFVITLIVYVVALSLTLVFQSLFFAIVGVLAEFINFYAFIAAKKRKENIFAKIIFYADIVVLIILNIVSFFAESLGAAGQLAAFVFEIFCVGTFLFIFEDRAEKTACRKWAVVAYIAYSVCSVLNSFVISNAVITILLLATNIALFVLLGITKRNRYYAEQTLVYSKKAD